MAERVHNVNQPEDLLEMARRMRRERDERIAKIRETKFDVEPHPGLKELVDSQDEYRDRIRAKIRALVYG